MSRQSLSSPPLDMSERIQEISELLFRIDERQKGMDKSMTEKMGEIKGLLSSKVSNDDGYQEMRIQHKTMWDWYNKAHGYILAWGSIGAIATTLAWKLIDAYVIK